MLRLARFGKVIFEVGAMVASVENTACPVERWRIHCRPRGCRTYAVGEFPTVAPSRTVVASKRTRAANPVVSCRPARFNVSSMA